MELTPTAVEWGTILPYILSAGSAGGGGFTYEPTEALASFFAQLQRGGSRFDYSGCRIAQATIRIAAGDAVKCSLDIFGVDETQNTATAFPALTLDNTTQFFIAPDCYQQVTIGDTQIDAFDVTITINNAVQPRLVNSQTATVVYTTDRVVTWRFDVPWGDDETLYNLAETGVEAEVQLINGDTELTITSPKLQVPRRAPDIPGRDELHNIIEGVARYGSAPNDEISIFLDLTP
jgi:hypothetical protein